MITQALSDRIVLSRHCNVAAKLEKVGNEIQIWGDT